MLSQKERTPHRDKTIAAAFHIGEIRAAANHDGSILKSFGDETQVIGKQHSWNRELFIRVL